MYGAPIAVGFEKVLASLDTSDYAILGKLGELNGHFANVPWIGNTYNTAGNRADRVVTKIVQNVSGGSLKAGSLVVRDMASGSYIHGVTTTTTANVQRQKLAGIIIGDTEFGAAFTAPTAIADDSICDIMQAGIYRVRCASGVSAGDLLGSHTSAGLCNTTTTADASFGHAIIAATDDGASGYYTIAVVNFYER